MNVPFTKDRIFSPAGRRILALWFPWLASERILRARLGRCWRSAAPADTRTRSALVVGRRENNASRVAALDERAAALGLRRGMGVADARAMHPGVEIVEADEEADRLVLESIADWCDRYTPLVAVCGADGLFLDVTGCAHLFGGEEPLLADVTERLSAQGFRARAGLASTPGAAWAAARFPAMPALVPPGAEAATLAPLPLAALRLEPAGRAGLESVGLRDVGAIMSAPRAALARRFGAFLLTRLDQALGRLEEAVSPRLPVPPLSVERRLAEPVATVEAIERLVLMLARSLKPDLERRGEGARALELALFRVDGAVRRLRVGASRPLREPELVKRLFCERLAAVTAAEGIDAGCGFELARLSALATAPFEEQQADLAGGRGGDAADLALFADRVRARLGQAALARPVPAESHVPERAVVLAPFVLRPPSRIGRGAPERPIRLFARPEPVEVAAAEVPEGPPLRFRWRRALHRVARAEGPERIAPEWWREEQDAPARDYFSVEDEAGRRYWLFRQGMYGASPGMPRWFMHGIFA